MLMFVRRILTLVVVVGVSLALAGLVQVAPVAAQPNFTELGQAVIEIEQLDALRSGLASSLEGSTTEPTMQTMKEVCKPVGMQAQKLSQDNGWQVKQVAGKYRNPAHAPSTLHEKMALAKFTEDPELAGFWQRETLNGEPGFHYFRRINVEASCLACHGSQERRPQFVKDNYPQDRAFDFQVGDLRGMYSVFIPDVQASIQEALQQGG